jgi:hypothetical protein
MIIPPPPINPIKKLYRAHDESRLDAWLPEKAPNTPPFMGVDRSAASPRFTNPPRAKTLREILADALHSLARWVDDWPRK